MFIIFKVYFLVALLWFSFCEAKRIKRSPVQISKSIIDVIPGSTSLLPPINITLEIDGCLLSTCCETCPPTTTPETCPPCPPETTREPCAACPPQTTCKTCEICPTEAPCKPCDACPTTTPCETCQTCPPATTGNHAETCPPPYPGKMCIEAGSFYCPLDVGGGMILDLCITTLLQPKSYAAAADECTALNKTLKFEIRMKLSGLGPQFLQCLSRIIPAFAVSDIKIWNLYVNNRKPPCSYTTFKTDGTEIIDTNGMTETNCNDEYSFICGVFLPK